MTTASTTRQETVVELKASDRDTLAVQFGQLCQVAGFLLSNINVQDQPAQGTASASKTAISSILNRMRSKDPSDVRKPERT